MIRATALPSLRRWMACSQLVCFLFAFALSTLAAPADAAVVPWKSRPFQIVANEKPLPDFLRELLASQGITAVIDPKIAGTISGKFGGQAQNILNSVATTYGLTWYYDGAFLYIDLAADAKSEVLPISRGNGNRIAETVARLHISDPRYPLVINENEGTVFISGPRRYVEMVRQAVKLSDQRAAALDKAEVRMFPLKYAWAADVKINRSGKETSVPGVVNVLRSLYSRNASTSSGPTTNRIAPAALRMGANRDIRLSTGDTVNAPKVEIGGMGAPSDEGGVTNYTTNGADLPQFQADTRMNAVLVRDLPERMALYATLIESMDTRPQLVEIEVTIMDISTDSLESLGIDWRLHGRHGDVQFGRGDAPPLTWNGATTEAGQTGATTPVGGVFTASIGNELRNYLLARVNALQKNGTANFVARPKVLTLNNTEAVLENLSEFHVRVDGFQDASLFNITAGTALRVTPLIIDEKTGRGVMMSVNIEDGDLSSETVDRIPIVRRRTVNTQAIVEESTSLLIAGFSSEEKVNGQTGVPVLSNIPVLGRLFKYSEKTGKNMERFYLLSPKLVVPAVASRSTTPATTVPPTAPAAPTTPAAPSSTGG
jgi:type III secretion protein C